jgi:6-phosphofructokinase 1
VTSALLVGQSGGPTAVINASLAGVIEEGLARPEIGTVLGMRRGIEGMLEGDLADISGMSSREIEVLARTPGSALGACRRKITEDESVRLVEQCRHLDVKYFCYIGGNDSADTTHMMASAANGAGYDLQAIAVPKTIDNDLPETDHCPGYGSIARYVAIAAQESTLDTRSLPTNYPIKIIEVMGRDAGWVAAASALARTDPEMGPHLVYVPERAFDVESFLASVVDLHRGLGYAVIVVTETIRDAEGQPIAADLTSTDSFGHPIVRGTAEALVRVVEDELGLPARFDRPGTLQRSSALTVSQTDLGEAREVGRAAVRLAVEGRSDLIVTLERVSQDPYICQTGSVGIDRVANRQKLLPPNFLDEAGTAITEEFRAYAMPLVGPRAFPEVISIGGGRMGKRR